MLVSLALWQYTQRNLKLLEMRASRHSTMVGTNSPSADRGALPWLALALAALALLLLAWT